MNTSFSSNTQRLLQVLSLIILFQFVNSSAAMAQIKYPESSRPLPLARG